MSSNTQEPINVIHGENTRPTRIGGPPIFRGVRWLTPWPRTWDARELTLPAHIYNSTEPLTKVLRDAANDFQEERPWPWAREKKTTSSWQLWEQYRMAIGLSYRPVVPRLAREVSDGEDSEHSDDEDGPPPRQPPSNQRPVFYKHRIFRGVGAWYEEAEDMAAERGMTPNEQWLRHTGEQRENMAQFLRDAEKATRHFFSAHFFHHQLHAAPEACDNMPIIASYFLRFLLRHIDFQDQNKVMFERALAVTEIARFELPLIHHYVKHCIVACDDFSLFCRVTFGEVLPTRGDLTMTFPNTSIPSLVTDDPGAYGSASDTSGSLPQTPAHNTYPDLPSVLGATVDLVPDDIERAWLSSSGAAIADAYQALDAIDVDDEDDPWTLKKPDLPIPDLALSYVRGLVESSVRRIMRVSPPVTGPAIPPDLDGHVGYTLGRTFWTVELIPQPYFRSWCKPDWEVWEGYESAKLRVQVDPRDSRDATIRLLVAPSVGVALTRCIGMLLCGDFAELAPCTGGKGELWYLHQFVGLAPSYYEPDRPALDEETLRAVREPLPED